jgi:hypothetical protein
VLVLGDSLAFHGPERAQPLDDPRLWPNLMGHELGLPVEVFARQGYTARDSWWSLTRDPRVWPLIGTAEAVLLATGGMDKLPTAMPTYLRTGLSYLPTERSRTLARKAYLAVNAPIVRATGGPLRTLGQRQTDGYHSRCVEALRAVRPDLPIAGIVTHLWAGDYYPSTVGHRPATAAAWAWGRREGVPMADWETVLAPLVPQGLNPDGMHLGWVAHALVAHVTADVLRAAMASAPHLGTDAGRPR